MIELTLENIVEKLKANCDKDDFVYVLSELLGYGFAKYGKSLTNELKNIIDETTQNARREIDQKVNDQFDKVIEGWKQDKEQIFNTTQNYPRKEFKIKSKYARDVAYGPYITIEER